MTTVHCTEYEEQLAALVDGALARSDRDRLERHLAICPACREKRQDLQRLCADLCALGAAIEAETPTVDLVARVTERVRGFNHACPTSAELMAYVAGELDEVGRVRLKQRIAAEPVLAEDVAKLEEMHAALEALGSEMAASLPDVDLTDEIMGRLALVRSKENLEFKRIEKHLEELGVAVAANTPEIDVVDNVLRSLGAVEQADVEVVPLRTRPKANPPKVATWRPRIRLWAGLAAAAGLIVALSLAWEYRRNAADERTRLARGPETGPHAPLAPEPRSPENATKTTAAPSMEEMFQAVRAGTRRLYIDTPVESAGEKDPPKPRAKGISLRDAINARRQALLKDVDALNRLGQWASLAPDEARALIAQGGLSTEAMVGVAQFLPPAEAAPLLEAAVDEKPEDPYLRYALAKTYAEDPGRSAEAQEQLLACAQLDPANSLLLYMEAGLFLEQGNEGNALSQLESAGQYETASPYSLDAALGREQALLASGMDPGVARFLAATSAGSCEYADMTQLSQQLLQYGSYYEAQGDYETAETIYSAVKDMGAQLVESAALANERLAGVDTEIAALDALQGISTVLGTEESLRIIETTYRGLIETIQELVTFFESFDEFFAIASDEEAEQAADQILQLGDIGLIEALGLSAGSRSSGS